MKYKIKFKKQKRIKLKNLEQKLKKFKNKIKRN